MKDRWVEAQRVWRLTLVLAVSEFKLRYYGNALGYFWTLAKPLLNFAVVYVVFTDIFDGGQGVNHYPAMLISGLVLYYFFAEATGAGVNSLVAAGNLLRKIPVPTLAVPLSVVLRVFFTLCLNLVAVIVFFVINGVEVTSNWLEFPLILAALLVFTFATSSVLACLYVPFRDTGEIWSVVAQVMFWGSAIMYPVEKLPEYLQAPAMCNPLCVIIVELRHSLVDPTAPTAVDVAGSGPVLVATGITVALLGASIWLHRRVTPQLAEQI
jgi:ABC-2 type transport system permease protein